MGCCSENTGLEGEPQLPPSGPPGWVVLTLAALVLVTVFAAGVAAAVLTGG